MNNNPTQVITGKVRFSYAYVFTPRAGSNDSEEKYSVTLLIPKSDTETINKILTAAEAAKVQGKDQKWGGFIPPTAAPPLHDGDGVKRDGTPFGAECKGHWVISASSKTPPEIVDANLQPIMRQTDFYSGCYGRASIRLYPYATNGNKGIACGLGNLQKLEDGEPLGGKTTASEDFGGFQPAAAPYDQNTYQTNAPQFQQPGFNPAPTNPYGNQGQPGFNPAQPMHQSGLNQNPNVSAQVLNPITGLPIATPPGGVMGI